MKTNLSCMVGAFAFAVLSCLTPAAVQANGVVDYNLPGVSETDGWVGITATNYPGYPGYSTSSDPWPNPIAANVGGSNGNGELDKVSGSSYPSGSSLYSPSGGTLSLSSDDTISGLETIIFQLDIGPAGGVALTGTPTLFINGVEIDVEDFDIYSYVGTGAYTFNFMGEPEDSFLYSYQWDLSGYVGTITSYEIQFSVGSHAQIYQMQVDTGNTFVQAVPEPSAMALVGVIGALGLLRRRRAA